MCCFFLNRNNKTSSISGEEEDMIQKHEASTISNADGTTATIKTDQGTVDLVGPGIYQKLNESKMLEFEKTALGFEIKNNPRTQEVLNKINFKMYPEMHELYDYYKAGNQSIRRLLVKSINDIRNRHRAR